MACGIVLLTAAFISGSIAEEAQTLEEAFASRDWTGVIDLTSAAASESRAEKMRAIALQQRGQDRFFDADIEGAIADFDAFLEIAPEEEPHHWQRGICYYYASEWEKGVAQFEVHQTVNSQDVENAVWHFLCAVRAPQGSVSKAREGLIPIEGDGRVPMAEVHRLFAGEGTAEQVLEAAAPQQVAEELSDRDRNHLCYAHLYLGLFYEITDQLPKAQEHITKAATTYRMDHYMGKVAQVHAKLRGWIQ